MDENNVNPDEQVVTMTIPDDQLNQQPSAPIEQAPVEPVVEQISTETPQESVQPVIEVTPQEISTSIIPEQKPAAPTGRPCEYCQNKDLIQSETEKYYRRFKDKLGTKEQAVPYYQELALELGYNRDTINDWTDKRTDKDEPEHPEFVRTIKALKTLQELLLLKRTLGRFNPTGAIFQLNNNHKGYESPQRKIVAGDREEPLQIEIINEKPTVQE